MTEKRSVTKSIFVGIWNTLNFSRKLFFNIIFLLIIIAIIVAISRGGSEQMTVPNSSALVLNLKGNLVIEKTYVDPTEKFFQEAFGEQEDNPEILLRDLVKAITNAAEDSRIEAIILSLDGFAGGGLDKLEDVGEALEIFKASGKPVYAYGNAYDRNQYFLASRADAVYLHPMGGMLLEGYSTYGSYFAEALEKVKASPHIFKVGKYKSAVEPFTRNDMSDDGNYGRYSLENGWVDGLRTRDEFRSEMIELLGAGDGDEPYNAISFDTYSSIINPPLPSIPSSGDKVAVVVARGTILDGEQQAGAIGGDSTARLLRKARMDDTVKAVVVQVDSGGGSAFASEIIRNEVELLKRAGKPVVASMSSVAASGGYWISASADHIIAEPSTITGSIGIFGMFLTFENSFEHLGIHSDGVAVNELSGIGINRELNQGYKDLIQMSIENGYDQFISLVARERGLTKEATNEVAQGRVWIGTQALELGLVDELGDVELAIAKAAELAQLEKFETSYIQRELTPQELFWQNFFQNASVIFKGANLSLPSHPLLKLADTLDSEIEVLTKFNDPMSSYVLCMECNVR